MVRFVAVACEAIRRNGRRRLQQAAVLALVGIGLQGCALLTPRDPISVDVVSVLPLESQELELRFAIKLRVQNPNDSAIDFDGASVQLDVRGARLGSGVTDQRGSVPRFGETVITLPVTVPLSALVRQGLSLAGGNTRTDYVAHGKLSGPLFGSARFESRGQLSLAGPGR